MPDVAVVLSPATDFTASGESCVTRRKQDPVIDAGRNDGFSKSYFPGYEATHPLLSPLFADLSGLPPMLIQVGDAETLLDDSTRLAAAAESDGVDASLEVWDGMPHVFQFFAPVLPEADAAVQSLAEFIRAHME
jgi:acetyl esterase/lipase